MHVEMVMIRSVGRYSQLAMIAIIIASELYEERERKGEKMEDVRDS
jgi:hypothetical protein